MITELPSTDNQTLAMQAYRVIRERILRCEYVFGTVISRRDLALELGMSLVPVNEAITRLENEYLIENTPRVGTKVRTPTPQEIRGFWAVREGLETQASRIFARKASDKECAELIQTAMELDLLHESCASSDEPDRSALYEWRASHMRLHTRIAECTGLPFLRDAIEKNQLLVFNMLYHHQLYGGRKLPERWHEHEQLARALAEKSEEIADAAMRRHLFHRLEELMQNLERFLLVDHVSLGQWNSGIAQEAEQLRNK